MPTAVFSALLVTMVLLLVGVSSLFFFGLLRRPGTRYATLWAAAFISAVLCAGAYFVCAQTGDVWWAVALGNASMAFTLGAVWAGCRAYNRRRPVILLVTVVVAVVAVSSALPSADGSKWAGAAEKSFALAVFSILIVVECLRAPLRRRMGAWLLAATLAVHAVYVIARGSAYLALGRDSAHFGTWFSTETVTAMNIVLVTVASAGIITVGAQDLRAIRTLAAADGSRQRLLGAAAFARAAGALPPGTPVTVMVAEIDLIDSYRRAIGVPFANAATDALITALLSATSATEICGRLSRDRFAVLSTRPAEAAIRLAEAVQRGYADRVAAREATFVSLGIAVRPAESGHRLSSTELTALITEARAQISWDPERGPGRIALNR